VVPDQRTTTLADAEEIADEHQHQQPGRPRGQVAGEVGGVAIEPVQQPID
jgi:hypothetical protein